MQISLSHEELTAVVRAHLQSKLKLMPTQTVNITFSNHGIDTVKPSVEAIVKEKRKPKAKNV